MDPGGPSLLNLKKRYKLGELLLLQASHFCSFTPGKVKKIVQCAHAPNILRYAFILTPIASNMEAWSASIFLNVQSFLNVQGSQIYFHKSPCRQLVLI